MNEPIQSQSLMKSLTTNLLLILITFAGSLLHGQSTIPIRDTAPFPDSLLYCASALLPDGRVMVWGGQKQAQTSGGKIALRKTSYFYAPDTETWSDGPELNAEVISPLVITLANGDIMSIGGQGFFSLAGIDSIPQRTNQVEIFDVSENQWIVADSIPFGDSPYTGTSGHLLPDSNVWLTTTNGDYGTLDHETLTWTDQSGIFGPLDAGGRPIVTLDNGIIFHTGAGGQYYDMQNQQITYADPVVPMHTNNVVKLNDGRILTWEDEFSFSQQALMVNPSGTASTKIDSLPIPGQATAGTLMPDGKVWVFGLGEIGFGPYTLLQIFDPATDTWSSPGTYRFRPDLIQGYHLHLLPDTSIVVFSTANNSDGTPTGSYRINAEGTTGLLPALSFLDWRIQFDQHAQRLRLEPGSASGEELMFTLRDLQGRVQLRRPVREAYARDLHGLPAGVYVVHLRAEDGAWMTRKIRID